MVKVWVMLRMIIWEFKSSRVSRFVWMYYGVLVPLWTWGLEGYPLFNVEISLNKCVFSSEIYVSNKDQYVISMKLYIDIKV